jgi:hypothetical protein
VSDVEALADAIAVASELAERLQLLLESVCVEKRKCRLCPAMLYFVRTRDRKALIPYTAEGLDHFNNCSGIHGRFEVRDAPKQQTLIDHAPDALEPKR